MFDKQLKEIIGQRSLFLQRDGNLDRCLDVVTPPAEEDGLDCFSFAHPASALVLESGDQIPLTLLDSEDLIVVDGDQALPLELAMV